jgi:hypothetical protein
MLRNKKSEQVPKGQKNQFEVISTGQTEGKLSIKTMRIVGYHLFNKIKIYDYIVKSLPPSGVSTNKCWK